MAGGKYSMTPVDVPPVSTSWRTIQTKLPVPESVSILEALQKYEPLSMQGQPPVVWDRASGIQIHDAWGNTWLDWSSGVLITNAGHGHPDMIAAITAVVEKPLLATYCFPHAGRAQLAQMLSERAPAGLDHVFMLSTGSEATENCIKLAKSWGSEKFGPHKNVIITFNSTFHGRTMGAQQAGGMPAGKTWIGNLDPTFVQVPFPDGFKNENTDFSLFLKTLADAGVEAKNVAGVMSETYQGVGPDFMPKAYAQQLRSWCNDSGALLIFDEVQAGFGRTGTYWGFEHYDVVPDLIACGKGISGGLPLSAVIGRGDILNLYGPGSMTSTHSASPVAAACAIANLEVIDRENLVRNAAELGIVLNEGLKSIREIAPDRMGCAKAHGLVGGIQIVHPEDRRPDPDTAFKINEACFHKGLLMFAPVGIGGECIKIAPPLSTTREALDEGLSVLREACTEVLG
jgi:4-aminobutyrate aminotransferase/(S)-3-amino-2-methylpropionate transaminase